MVPCWTCDAHTGVSFRSSTRHLSGQPFFCTPCPVTTVPGDPNWGQEEPSPLSQMLIFMTSRFIVKELLKLSSGHVFCFPSIIVFFLVPGHRLKSLIMGPAQAKVCMVIGTAPAERRCVTIGPTWAEVCGMGLAQA